MKRSRQWKNKGVKPQCRVVKHLSPQVDANELCYHYGQ